jgi:hypothetical protein
MLVHAILFESPFVYFCFELFDTMLKTLSKALLVSFSIDLFEDKQKAKLGRV